MPDLDEGLDPGERDLFELELGPGGVIGRD